MKYGVIEKRHESLKTKQKVGHVVESYLLPAPTSLKGLDGRTRQYPKGTWIVTAEITDEETIAETQKGIYTGFSATTIPKEVADNVSFKASQGQLIKDIPNPVGFAVSLVEKPCVSSAKFCKLKQKKNEESNMNNEDREFLESLKNIFSFKGKTEPAQNDEFVTKAALKGELNTFKSELIAGVTAGVAQAVKEALKEPQKKKEEEKEENKTGENNKGGNDNSNNSSENNNTTSSSSDDENTQNNEDNSSSNNENTQNNNNNSSNNENEKKKKKPPVATKGNQIHDGPEPAVATKSDSKTILEIMGRNSRGSRIQE